ILDAAMTTLEPGDRLELHRRILDFMKGRTVVAAVERPDLARLYDQVIVLDAGSGGEAGSYQGLIVQEDGGLAPVQDPRGGAGHRGGVRCSRSSATSRPCGRSPSSPACPRRGSS